VSLTVGAPVMLSRDFSLRELTRTATGLPNEPTEDRELASLVLLATRVLQPIRDEFGPLLVTSGFRSPEVNAAVGGAETSAHLEGRAADFRPGQYGITVMEVFRWIARHRGIPWGQVIWERPGPGAWVHVSLRREGAAPQALVWRGDIYEPWEEGAV
jgi:hypothetical protein